VGIQNFTGLVRSRYQTKHVCEPERIEVLKRGRVPLTLEQAVLDEDTKPYTMTGGSGLRLKISALQAGCAGPQKARPGSLPSGAATS
jgi:hypothetical protein